MKTQKTPRKPKKNARGWCADMADRFHVERRTARRWRAAGCPRDLDGLRLWLASRRQNVIERDQSAGKPATTPHRSKATIEAGAANSLRRLESEEVATFEVLQDAIATGDPLRVKLARADWLKCAESLRKLDAAIEQSRRDAGELRPVAALRDAFTLLQTGVRLQLNHFGDHIANDALMAGAVALLADEKHQWLHDTICEQVDRWVAQADGHTVRALILYAEVQGALRGEDVPAEDAAALFAVARRVIEKSKNLPPILPKAEYEEREFRRILAEGAQRETNRGQPAAKTRSV